jgi:type IV secretory pathway VirJ component
VLRLGACGAASAARGADRRGRLGAVALRHPDDAPEALVFLFGATGRDADAAAQKLVDADAAVVTVDLAKYQAGLRASDDGCHYLISEIEALSKKLQRQLDATAYRSPILAGVGEGATLAYAALAHIAVRDDRGRSERRSDARAPHEGAALPGRAVDAGRGWSLLVRPAVLAAGFWRVSSRTPLATGARGAGRFAPTPVRRPATRRSTGSSRSCSRSSTRRPPPGVRDLPLTEIEAEQPAASWR